MPRPDFFIVGAPKSGTTALYAYLKTHPNIFLPEMKEPCYFAQDIAGDYGQIKTREEYEALYAPAEKMSAVMCGDASPIYMVSGVAVENILAYNPGAKIIAIVRNPVQMAISMHNQALKVPEEDVEDFEAAWRLQAARAAGQNLPKFNLRPVNLQYKHVSALGSQLERLVDVVPAAQLLMLVQDDMQTDPAAVYRRVLDFLGLPHDGRADFPAHNQRADLRSRRFQAWMKNPPRMLWPLRRLFHLLGLRPLKLASRLNRRKPSARPLRPAFKAELLREYESEIKKIERIFQRDFSNWRTF